MQLRRRWVVVLLIVLALTAPVATQTFTAQIQQFWNLLRTGALTFVKVSGSSIAMGSGVPTTNIPFFASFNINGQLQAQWLNTSTGTSAYAEWAIKSNDVTTYFGSESSTNSDTFGQSRGYLISNGATNGQSGMDFYACSAATPTGCFFRWITNGATTSQVRMTLSATSLSLSNGAVVLGVDGSNTNPTYSYVSDPDTGWYWGGSGTSIFAANGTRPVMVGGNGVFTGSDGAVNWTNAAGNASTTVDLQLTRRAAGEFGWTAVLQANLGTPANGSFAYCSDCTIANPCAGGGTGALAKRLNGVWVCN